MPPSTPPPPPPRARPKGKRGREVGRGGGGEGRTGGDVSAARLHLEEADDAKLGQVVGGGAKDVPHKHITGCLIQCGQQLLRLGQVQQLAEKRPACRLPLNATLHSPRHTISHAPDWHVFNQRGLRYKHGLTEQSLLTASRPRCFLDTSQLASARPGVSLPHILLTAYSPSSQPPNGAAHS